MRRAHENSLEGTGGSAKLLNVSLSGVAGSPIGNRTCTASGVPHSARTCFGVGRGVSGRHPYKPYMKAFIKPARAIGLPRARIQVWMFMKCLGLTCCDEAEMSSFVSSMNTQRVQVPTDDGIKPQEPI